MDCHYIDQNELHELFFMDKLDADTKKEYLKHLEQCEKCRIEQEKERSLGSGIRQYARLRLKDEIKRQVEEIRRERREQLYSFYKIAAVVFVFAFIPSLYIYYQETGVLMQEKKVAIFEEIVSEEISDEENITSVEIEKKKTILPEPAPPNKVIKEKSISKKSRRVATAKVRQPALSKSVANIDELSAGAGVGKSSIRSPMKIESSLASTKPAVAIKQKSWEEKGKEYLYAGEIFINENHIDEASDTAEKSTKHKMLKFKSKEEEIIIISAINNISKRGSASYLSRSFTRSKIAGYQLIIQLNKNVFEKLQSINPDKLKITVNRGNIFSIYSDTTIIFTDSLKTE